MSRNPNVSLPTMTGRALRRRCPRCGVNAFSSYFTMLDRCRSCGIRFERESGYWVGALIINTAVVFLSFLILFVGGVLITWPDPPWLVLMILTITVNAILPVVFYPQSKTLWMALELSWHPLEESEIIDARRHRPSEPVDGARP